MRLTHSRGIDEILIWHATPVVRKILVSLFLLLLVARSVLGQASGFGGNAQHAGIYEAAAQPLNSVRWTASIDLYNSTAFAHYGAPLITTANTLVIPVRTNVSSFKVAAYQANVGRLKYELTTDYLLPPFNWVPVFQPVLATNQAGARLYYGGAGGTVFYVNDPDSDSPGAPVRLCFYNSVANYLTNTTLLNSNVYINSALTADADGAVFFAFRLLTNGPSTSTANTRGGFARIDPTGSASYVLSSAVIGLPNAATTPPHNCAPALSPDGSILYVVVKQLTSATTSFLLGLDSHTLATRYKVSLISPVSGAELVINSDSTATPTIGPDGDVYYGVIDADDRGYVLHFSADLSVRKLPSGFGWDNTVAIVPTNMVPGYTGRSTYLLASKYNNYAAIADGDGVNRIALLDPNVPQMDFHPTELKLSDMRIVMSVIGPTPDAEHLSSSYPYAVREWCVNAAAVNPANSSIYISCEDGLLYRWNLASNSLSETVRLGAAVGEPYVPTVVGPDGVVYTLNGRRLLGVGGLTNLAVSVASSIPDLSLAVAGNPVTFTATVADLTGLHVPGGAITFSDVTYSNLTVLTNILAANVPLSGGIASVVTSNLSSGGKFLGNHFITAFYTGDGLNPSGSATMVQKIHFFGTTLTLSSQGLSGGTNLLLTAVVSPNQSTTSKPTGLVTFFDRSNVLAQLPLTSNGSVSITNQAPVSGEHAFRAVYESDTLFAGSSGVLAPPAPLLSAGPGASNLGFQLLFSNLYGGSFTVLGSSNLFTPMSNWSVLGMATQSVPGLFRFEDAGSSNSPLKYYRVRNP